MKHFILIGFMSIFTSCFSQKKVKNDAKTSFSTENDHGLVEEGAALRAANVEDIHQARQVSNGL